MRRWTLLLGLLVCAVSLMGQDSGEISLTLINDSTLHSMGEVIVTVDQCPDWITVTPGQLEIADFAPSSSQTLTFQYNCAPTGMTRTGSIILKAEAWSGDVLTEEYTITQVENHDNQIIIALDRSYSMNDLDTGTPAGYNAWNVCRLSLMDFLNYLDYGDDVAMIDFGLHPTDVIDKTALNTIQNKNTVIDELSLSGGLGINNATTYYNPPIGEVYGFTSLGNLFDTEYDNYPTYTDIFRMADTDFSLAGKVHVVLITDGGENDPSDDGYNPLLYHSVFHPLSGVSASDLRSRNICLHTVVIEGHNGSSPGQYDEVHALLYRLSAETGGSYHHVPRESHIANINSALLAIYNDIRNQEQLLFWSKRITAQSSAHDYLPVPVDHSIGQLRIGMFWTRGEGTSANQHGIELVKPDGNHVTVSTTDPLVHYNEMGSGITGGMHCFDIDNPDPGLWYIDVIRDPSMSCTYDDISLTVTAYSTIKMTAGFNYETVHFLDTPVLEVSLTHNNTPMEGMRVTVDIQHQAYQGSGWSYPEHWEATDIGNGLYTLPLTCFTEKGYYRLDVTGTDNLDTPTFKRTKRLFLNMMEETLSPPANLIIEVFPQTSFFSLTWDPVPGAGVYYIWGASTASGPFSLVNPEGTEETSYLNTLGMGGYKFFRVVAATN